MMSKQIKSVDSSKLKRDTARIPIEAARLRPVVRAIRTALLIGTAATWALPDPAFAAIPCPVTSSVSLTAGDSVGDCTINNTGSLSVQPGGTLGVNGALNNYGSLSTVPLANDPYIWKSGGHIDLYGNIINHAGGVFGNGGTLYQFSGTLENQFQGIFNNTGYISTGANTSIVNGGAMANAGLIISLSAINNQTGGTLTNTGTLGNGTTLSNSGTLTNEKTGTLHNYFLSSGATLTNQSSGILNNAGTLTNDAGAQLSNSGQFNNSGGLNSQGTINNLSGGTLSNSNFISSSSLTNSGTLQNTAGATFDNQGSLTNSGNLINDGILSNAGNLTMTSGSFTGSGQFNNSGTLEVQTGASVHVGNTSNLANSTLSGGVWLVKAGTGSADLSLGNNNAAITTLASNATVSLYGAGARFSQLEDHLSTLYGTLRIGAGHVFNQSQTLVNNGLLDIQAGGELDNSGNLKFTTYNINRGVLINQAGAKFESTGKLTNNNTLKNYGSVTNVNYLNNFGTIVNNAGAYMHISDLEQRPGSSIIYNHGGTLTMNTFSYSPIVNDNGGIMNLHGDVYGPGSSLTNKAGSLINGTFSLVTGARMNNWGAVNAYMGFGAFTFHNYAGGTFSGIFNNNYLSNHPQKPTLINEGTMTLNGSFSHFSGGEITNSGSLVVSTSFTEGGTITNSGVFELTKSSVLDRWLNDRQDFVQTAGTLTVDGTLVQDAIHINGGTVNGNGTINSALTIDGGTLSPGHSLGALTLNGALQLNTGNLDIELAGTGTGQYDQLKVNGETHLGGTLDLFALNSFKPAAGDSFDILYYTALFGNFTDVKLFGFDPGLSANLNFAADHLNINFTSAAVPLPSAFWLFGSALLAGVTFSNRRKLQN